MFNQNLETITNLTQITQFEDNGRGNHFRCCKKLKSIDLSNVTVVAPLKSSYGTFCSLQALETVKLSAAFTQIDGAWFTTCPNLKEVHFKSTTPLTIGDDCSSTFKFFVDGSNGDTYKTQLKIYVPTNAKSSYLNATSGFANPDYNGVAAYLGSMLFGE